MNMQELQETKLTRMSHGRPSYTLTDKKWQQQFQIMRLCTEPYRSTSLKLVAKKYNPKEYDGITNWQSYCWYINDVLSNIRSGERDYCYFAYQIKDLLKFHYNTLRTKYCDGYWEVWLEQ